MTATLNKKLIFIFALVLAFTTIYGSDNYLPSFPALSEYFNVPNAAIKLSLSVYYFAMGLSQLVYGPWSDRIGRKPVLLFGYSLLIVGSFLCAFSSNVTWFLFGRLIQGLGVGAGMTLFRAIMRDVFSGSTYAKVASIAATIISITPPLAPIIGGYVQHYISWQANFWLYGLALSLFWFWMWRYLPETRKLKPDSVTIHFFTQVKEVLSSRIFLTSLTCSSLAFSMIIVYLTMSPYLLQNTMQLTPVEYGWTGIVPCLGMAIGSLINSRFIGRVSIDNLMVVGGVIGVIGALILCVTGLMGVVTVSSVLWGMGIAYFGIGMIFPNATASALLPFPHIAGLAGALYGASQMIITSLVGSLSSMVHVHNQEVIGFLMLSCSIVVVLVKLFIREERHD